MRKLLHEQLSRAIIGIATEVLNELKPALDRTLIPDLIVDPPSLSQLLKFNRGLHG